MTDSILTSVKNGLGLVESYVPFDQQLVIYINTAFATLKQLGVGPTEGFAIADSTATWDAFISDDVTMLSSVKSYVIIKVRLIFDPPTTAHMIESLNQVMKELEWRLNTEREETEWVAPTSL